MAAPAAAVGAQEASKAASSVYQAAVRFLETPLYMDKRTTTYTNPKTGVTTVHETGWSVSNGLVLGGLLTLAAWEAVSWLAHALNGSLTANVPGTNVPWFLAVTSPATWPLIALEVTDPKTGEKKTVQVAQPPSGLAALDQLMAQLVTPGLSGSSILSQRIQEILAGHA